MKNPFLSSESIFDKISTNKPRAYNANPSSSFKPSSIANPSLHAPLEKMVGVEQFKPPSFKAQLVQQPTMDRVLPVSRNQEYSSFVPSKDYSVKEDQVENNISITPTTLKPNPFEKTLDVFAKKKPAVLPKQSRQEIAPITSSKRQTATFGFPNRNTTQQPRKIPLMRPQIPPLSLAETHVSPKTAIPEALFSVPLSPMECRKQENSLPDANNTVDIMDMQLIDNYLSNYLKKDGAQMQELFKLIGMEMQSPKMNQIVANSKNQTHQQLGLRQDPKHIVSQFQQPEDLSTTATQLLPVVQPYFPKQPQKPKDGISLKLKIDLGSRIQSKLKPTYQKNQARVFMTFQQKISANRYHLSG